MKENLLQFIVDPEDLSPLQYNQQQQQLLDVTQSRTYPIRAGVPILLKANALQNTQQSEHHQRQQTNFTYVEHYQKDAVAFDYFAAPTDGATIHENRRLHEGIVAQIPPNVKNILDVGSGGAWLAQTFANTETQVISFDISTTNTIQALEKYPFKNHHAVTGDVYALPFLENTFDCIVSAEVIEHVPDPQGFVQNLLRVLKPGGTLIITTPYDETIQYSLCIHCNCVTPLHAHLHTFNHEKITRLIPPHLAQKVSTDAFANKALTTLRTHILLKYLPFKIWYSIDKIVNKIIKKPNRLLMKVIKI